MAVWETTRSFSDRLLGPCFRQSPCLSEPARRSSVGLKAALVLLHAIFVGVLFILDTDLIRKTREMPWFTMAYLLLVLATIVQYFVTACTSPGHVIDAMAAGNEMHASYLNSSRNSMQHASKNGDLISSLIANQSCRSSPRTSSSSWSKMVMDLYPPGSSTRSWTCIYCNVVQPPRSKHCHDCDKCVLQFDHHCVWLGTCIGRGNHCRFWWYIFTETAVCIWSGALYITLLRSNLLDAWWKIMIVVIFLTTLTVCIIFLLLLLFFHSFLVLTNQTTYELVRRRRILYLRGIPERVRPFSLGMCRNMLSFCCSFGDTYNLEAVPTLEEIEERTRPYSCTDFLAFRCC